MVGGEMGWGNGYMSIAELKRLPHELRGIIFLGSYESGGKHLYVIVKSTNSGVEAVQIDRLRRTRNGFKVKRFSDDHIVWLPDQQYGRRLYPQSWAELASMYTFLAGDVNPTALPRE